MSGCWRQGGRTPGAARLSVRINHAIVTARDRHIPAASFASLFGLPAPSTWGPFTLLTPGEGVHLQFAEPGPDDLQPQHLAFLVDDGCFNAVHARLPGIEHGTDPQGALPGQLHRDHGGPRLRGPDAALRLLTLRADGKEPPPLPVPCITLVPVIDLIARKTPPAGLRPALRASLAAAMRHFGVEDREVTVVLVGDRAIRALKREHWGEDAATDVLSFPTWEPGDPFVPPHLGDIIISLDTAGRQAGARGHSLTREVALLASHGLTHLAGFDHPHAGGLGFEEGATGEEWQVFHDAWDAARAALPPHT